MRWRSVPPDALAWREFDGQAVVRNARTGSTHLLEGLACELLRELAASGGLQTIDELSARLLARFPGDNGAEWSPAISQALRELERLGLIEPEKA